MALLVQWVPPSMPLRLYSRALRKVADADRSPGSRGACPVGPIPPYRKPTSRFRPRVKRSTQCGIMGAGVLQPCPAQADFDLGGSGCNVPPPPQTWDLTPVAAASFFTLLAVWPWPRKQE